MLAKPSTRAVIGDGPSPIRTRWTLGRNCRPSRLFGAPRDSALGTTSGPTSCARMAAPTGYRRSSAP
eukprot:scaffold309_cov235-Pinguiococcus_pyrenoidosus.AAC.4